MDAEERDEILLMEGYGQRRTPEQLREWVETIHSRLRNVEKTRRFKITEKGIGKKFIKEIYPLSLFARSYYRGRDDVFLETRLGNQSFDAQVFEGGKELCKIEITEAIDGLKWAWQKELLLENGWTPGTGPIECSSRKHNRKRGDIKAKLEAVEHTQAVQKELDLIEKALDKKSKKSNSASGAYEPGTWLLVAFDDTTALHPDLLSPDEKNGLRHFVRRKIDSIKPNFDRVFLVGWSGSSLYEFPVHGT